MLAHSPQCKTPIETIFIYFTSVCNLTTWISFFLFLSFSFSFSFSFPHGQYTIFIILMLFPFSTVLCSDSICSIRPEKLDWKSTKLFILFEHFSLLKSFSLRIHWLFLFLVFFHFHFNSFRCVFCLYYVYNFVYFFFFILFTLQCLAVVVTTTNPLSFTCSMYNFYYLLNDWKDDHYILPLFFFSFLLSIPSVNQDVFQQIYSYILMYNCTYVHVESIELCASASQFVV